MTTPSRAMALLRIPPPVPSPWTAVVQPPRASSSRHSSSKLKLSSGSRIGAVPAQVHPCALGRDWTLREYHQRASAVPVSALVAMEADLEAGAGHGEAEAVGVSQLVADLRAAYKCGRTDPAAWRVQQLKAILRMLAEREGEITGALFADLGKPVHEAYFAEISLIRSSCKRAISELKKWMAPVKVSGNMLTFPSTGAIVPEPLGVTLVISAWNFPFLLSVDPLIGAIAAGCATVLKPSEVAPATSALLAKLIPLYLDTTVIRVVEGGVAETTALLEQKWDKIFYTGSPRVGRVVMAAAAKHLTPVTLELGGKCPAYFDSSANLKVGLRRIAQGKRGSNYGQACIAPDYILVDESIASELVDTLKGVMEQFYGKDPKLSNDLCRIVNASHFSRISKLLDDPLVSSKVVHGGERDPTQLYIAPTLVCDVPLDAPLMSEEIFGPVLPIIKVKGEQEATDIINDRNKPLAAYIFTSKKEVQERMVANISAGGLVVNDTVLHFVNPGLPFGGVGESGMGSYHGKFSFDAFSHQKAVLYRSTLGDVPARFPPYTTKKKKLLRCALDGDFHLLTFSFPRRELVRFLRSLAALAVFWRLTEILTFLSFSLSKNCRFIL